MITVSFFLSAGNGCQSEQDEDNSCTQVDSSNDTIVKLTLDDRVNAVLIGNTLLNALCGVEEREIANATALKLLFIVPDFFELFLIVGYRSIVHFVTRSLGS